MRTYILILILLGAHIGMTRAQQTKVLTLGTFHFSFPNLDIVKTAESDQIDVLEPRYQAEIREITDKIARFKPTIIAIEANPSKQSKIDSLYQAYLSGTHELTRDERQQIGFRLGKQLGLKKLYCVDDWGRHYEDIETVLTGGDSITYMQFEDFFYHNPDSLKFYHPDDVYKTEGITAELIRTNKEAKTQKDLGNYLIGVFKFETEDDPFFGPDFVSGWWFDRNLRIFRNIQKIGATADDRILVIYGSGHMNILNPLFEASPEFELVPAGDYLE